MNEEISQSQKAGKKIQVKVKKNLYSNVHITINDAQELNT